MAFIPQLTIPVKDNKYFIRKAYGGFSPCIKGKPEYFRGSVLANCVGLAWGMAAMREQDPGCNIGFHKGRDYPGDAHTWINNPNGRKTGMKPKLGAIACWINNNGRTGHVASVEVIYPDGSFLCAESGYPGIFFRTRKYPAGGKWTNHKFQGFIYLNMPEPEELNVGDKVEILAPGNSRTDGTGKKSGGIGWIREVLKIFPGEPYPYRIGKNGRTTGYYTADALKKI